MSSTYKRQPEPQTPHRVDRAVTLAEHGVFLTYTDHRGLKLAQSLAHLAAPPFGETTVCGRPNGEILTAVHPSTVITERRLCIECFATVDHGDFLAGIAAALSS